MEASLISFYTVGSSATSAWSAVLATHSCSYFVSCPRWYPLVHLHSLCLSTSAVWQLSLPCCHSHWHFTSVWRDGKDEGKWREKKEPPVTSSLWSCMAARFNLLHYWFLKPNNCTAMVFSGPSPAETRIEWWPDDALTSWCVCVCVCISISGCFYRPRLGGKQLLGDDWHPAPHLPPYHFLLTNQ